MAAIFDKMDEIPSLRKQRVAPMGWQEHILIVDDEPNFRFATGIALRRAGYAITEADSAEEALHLLADSGENEPFDLMLVDVQMPGMSGIELIDEIRKRNITMPIFVVSAFADKGLADELSRKGCKELLHKPFEPCELIEKVMSVLKMREDRSCPA